MKRQDLVVKNSSARGVVDELTTIDSNRGEPFFCPDIRTYSLPAMTAASLMVLHTFFKFAPSPDLRAFSAHTGGVIATDTPGRFPQRSGGNPDVAELSQCFSPAFSPVLDDRELVALAGRALSRPPKRMRMQNSAGSSSPAMATFNREILSDPARLSVAGPDGDSGNSEEFGLHPNYQSPSFLLDAGEYEIVLVVDTMEQTGSRKDKVSSTLYL